MPSKKAPSFEKSLEALSATVKQMESGDLSLEESLKSFEQGIGLVRECQNALDQAELKVQKLIETQDGLETEDFQADDA